MTSSSSSADIFNRLQLFRGAGNEGDHDFDPDRPPRPNPAASRVKRCLFGRGNHEENIKFAKRELEKSRTESKNKWNFDFENERPIDGGRYEWLTSPYPKPISLKNRLTAAQENVENLHPASASASSVSGASVSGSATSADSLAGSSISENISSNPSIENSNSSKHTSPTPSDEQICDPNLESENPDLSGNNPDLKTSNSSSSSSSDSNQGPSSPSNQRKSSRPINQIYRQRKRSKSKVKTQERKSETEDDRHLTASTTSKTASAVLGGASKSSQESD